ncbi:zinc finger BED domain-containing protein RICESLEEPER 2-like isoform X3 [Cucumis melo var. makuwa]|uniref:Zinc finger BED domain-containing protein RICESLEEPER 2-like isoform X3 n=1 Tax=Cucumis melo var. makuwa TaxID=1194695 RepID=A0A5A7SQH2_CUCMM|nr:zinc finger BED domain-containing protein RICESLEEPER 2-like isoform X3 [Cucumis melo var. makuwa]TYK17071.1 zinc finger BED domain-containing protein RICESLEEPER 2-like isoform X3 [Cucumis melo var. makuwa]
MREIKCGAEEAMEMKKRAYSGSCSMGLWIFGGERKMEKANHKGDTIGRAIEKCLEGRGIDRLFTVIVGNASSNDVAIAYLVKKVKGRNGLMLDDGAIKCQKTFERLKEHDPSYLPNDDIPTVEDWDSAKVFVKFLKTFSGVTMKFSASIFKQSNKTCLDDAKTEVTRYLDEAHIKDEYLDLLNWWKVNSSRFKIISQVVRDMYSIPISIVPSEFAFSTGGRVLTSFRSSLTPQTAEPLICAQNWIQSKTLDDMTEEIDGAEEIDEEFINIGKEMEAAFENLNNDSMV